jgi:hypothetical protein
MQLTSTAMTSLHAYLQPLIFGRQKDSLKTQKKGLVQNSKKCIHLTLQGQDRICLTPFSTLYTRRVTHVTHMTARLDDDVMKKLKLLKERLGLRSTNDVVERLLKHYDDEVSRGTRGRGRRS